MDPVTVLFGPEQAAPLRWAFEDVDGDGDIDMILLFRTQETGIKVGDLEACLIGSTHGGVSILGCDSVRTVPPGP